MAVPPAGFPNEAFAISTDQTFTAAGTIVAKFTWDPTLTGGSSSSSSAASTSDYASVYPVVLKVVDVLAYLPTPGTAGGGAYQSVSGGTLDVKTQITGGTNGHLAHVRLQVTGPPARRCGRDFRFPAARSIFIPIPAIQCTRHSSARRVRSAPSPASWRFPEPLAMRRS